MTPDPKQATTTHVCAHDGKVRPGKGPHGKGADRCAPCFNEYHKARRKRLQDEKWSKGGIVGPVKLNHDGAASTRHGFYRKKLDAEEAKLASALHAEFMEKYDLDSLADDLLLVNAVVNFVKSLRPEPEFDDSKRDKDKNVRDYQAYYERNFKEALQALALTRKDRKENDKKDDFQSHIDRLFRNKAKEQGFGAPNEGTPSPAP